MTRQRRLAIALGANLVLVVMQVVFGVVAHSLSLLADAAHNLTDVAAVGLSLVAVYLTGRRATPRRSFGYHRSTTLAAQANAVILLVMTALIVFEGIRRALHPNVVHGGVVAVVASVALALNLVAAALLHDGTHDLNMRSSLLHMLGDALASAGVVLAGVVIFIVGGAYWLDPVVSIVIGLVIGYHAVRLLGKTTDVLLESTPHGLDIDALVAAIQSVEGVEAVHDLHVWTLSSDLYALSSHLVVDGHPTLEQARVVGERTKTVLRDSFHIGHATLELECEPCHDGSHDPCGVNDVDASARHARAGH
jgi:cobalt-zinc-cadmium efflux system protein